MPQIIPINNLKNTSAISEMCHKSKEPIFITKNGYGDMVLMSIETYEKNRFVNEVYEKVLQAEKEIATDKSVAGTSHLDKLMKKYEI